MAEWDQREDETEADFLAFKAYRDQPPPRNLRRTAQMLIDHTFADVVALCNKFDWRARVKQWDTFLDKILQDERIAFIRQDTQRRTAEHMSLLKDAREFLTIEIRKLLARAEECRGSTAQPQVLVKLLDSVIKLERLVAGESTENTKLDTMDMSGLTPEELRKAYELLQKGSGGALIGPGKRDTELS